MHQDLKNSIVRALGMYDGPALIRLIDHLGVDDKDIQFSFRKIRIPAEVVDKNIEKFETGMRKLRQIAHLVTKRTFPVTRNGHHICIDIVSISNSVNHRNFLFMGLLDYLLLKNRLFREYVLSLAGSLFDYDSMFNISPRPRMANFAVATPSCVAVSGGSGGDPDKGGGSEVCLDGDERAKPTKKIVYRGNGKGGTIAFFVDIPPEEKSIPRVLHLRLCGQSTH